jgi:hypothetical protein
MALFLVPFPYKFLSHYHLKVALKAVQIRVFFCPFWPILCIFSPNPRAWPKSHILPSDKVSSASAARLNGKFAHSRSFADYFSIPASVKLTLSQAKSRGKT